MKEGINGLGGIIAVVNPAIVGSIGGMKVIFDSIIHMEKFFESFQSSIITSSTYLLNDYPTRKHLDVNDISVSFQLKTIINEYNGPNFCWIHV